MDNQENSFWKHSNKAVPGRPSPKKVVNKNPAAAGNSFQNYQASVKDAWELGDDEYCILYDRHTSSNSNKQHKTIGVHKASGEKFSFLFIHMY